MDNLFPLEAPPGFRGLNPHEPVIFKMRHLPHWYQKGASYFITFRLTDSIPQIKIDELKRASKRMRQELDLQKTEESMSDRAVQESIFRFTFEKTEGWLDQGMGKCILRENRIRNILSEEMESFEGEQYEIGSYVIIPNHVHMIIRPVHEFDLSKILQTLKRISSFKINRLNKKQGPLWQSESYDRIVRDAQHLWKCLQYIGNNPRKANLKEGDFTRWINPHWQILGWDFVG